MRIDIGGGTIPAPGYINLDPKHGEGQWRGYVQDGIPVPDNSVERVRASHVMEHIPAGDQRIFVMNEVFRVLKPKKEFEIIVPLICVHNQMVQGWWAWADPTHVSQWVFPESFMYFTEGPFKPNADYGISVWQALREEDMKVVDGWEGHVILRKP